MLSARTALFIAVNLVSLVGWLMFYHWYALSRLADTPYFGLEKIPGHFASWQLRGTTVVFAALAAAYLAGFLILRSARVMTTGLKLTLLSFSLAHAVTAVLLYPFGALDAFNYLVWLKLDLVYGLNPYVHNLLAFPNDPLGDYTTLNYVSLFYGPVWLLVSSLPLYVVGFVSLVASLIALKALNLVLLALSGLVVFHGCGDGRERWLRVYLLVANPLVVFEGLANGHNDIMVMTLLLGALLALRHRSAAAGPLLAGSALVKFFTIPLAPLFLAAMALERWPRRAVLVSLLASIGLALALFLPYWAQGELPSALKRSMFESQQYDTGSVVSLVSAHFRRAGAAEETLTRIKVGFAAIFVIGAGVALWTLRHGRPVEAVALDTFLLFLLFVSLLPPWYLIVPIGLLVLQRQPLDRSYLFLATALGLLYYPALMWALFSGHWPDERVQLLLGVVLSGPMLAYLALKLPAGVRRRLESWALQPVGSVRRQPEPVRQHHLSTRPGRTRSRG
jgi:hypothetical protein